MQQRRRPHDESILESIAYLDRLSAKVIAPAPSCNGCHHFQPNPINSTTGVGLCGIGHGTHYPRARHRCKDFQELPSPKDSQ